VQSLTFSDVLLECVLSDRLALLYVPNVIRKYSSTSTKIFSVSFWLVPGFNSFS